jgi:hypothetical protein
LAGGGQVSAVLGTSDLDQALGGAADGTDDVASGGAFSLRLARLTNRAAHGSSQS